jgi:succinate-acetate transporter protein
MAVEKEVLMNYLRFLGWWFLGWRGIVSYIMATFISLAIVANSSHNDNNWKVFLAFSLFWWVFIHLCWVNLVSDYKKAETMVMLNKYLSRKLKE